MTLHELFKVLQSEAVHLKNFNLIHALLSFFFGSFFVLQQVLEAVPVRSSWKIIHSGLYFLELRFHFTRLFRLHLAVCSTGSEIFTDYFGRTLYILMPAKKKKM